MTDLSQSKTGENKSELKWVYQFGRPFIPFSDQQYLSMYRARHPEIVEVWNAIDGYLTRRIDGHVMRSIQSKQAQVEALANGYQKGTTQGSPHGGAITGRTDGGCNISETDRRRLGEGDDGSVKSFEPSEKPLWDTHAGCHQTRHTSLPQARTRLGQENRGGVMSPLTVSVVKLQGGHQVEIGIDMSQSQTWTYAQRANGTSGQTAYLTAPEMDRMIAVLCKARDDCRKANTPKPSWGTYRT